MKEKGYHIFRAYIKISLYLFHKKIEVSGLENIPKYKPVLFLPNHQNALIDALLIGVDCNRDSYFLTRSDVFKNTFFKRLFTSFKMIPVYRIQDGRGSLKNNEAVFKRCANLLCDNNAVLLFPEANHNLLRRVRPLSKGFTRILFAALEKDPNLDLQIVPVGVNYKEATHFPDKAGIYFGEPISVQKLYNPKNLPNSILKIKTTVSAKLKTLTTHIDSELNYDAIISKLDIENVNFLNPEAVNKRVEELTAIDKVEARIKKKGLLSNLARGIFNVFNLPIVLLWRKIIKPKVPEAEFIGTFRFVFSLLAFPLYYGLLYVSVGFLWNWYSSLALVLGIFIYNYLYVKLR